MHSASFNLGLTDLDFAPITNMCDRSPFDWSANEYGAKTCFPQSPRRFSPSERMRSFRRRSPISVCDGLSARREQPPLQNSDLRTTKHHRQKSHITSTRTSLWFEGGCWGEGRRKIAGRQDQYARYWAGNWGPGEHLLISLP